MITEFSHFSPSNTWIEVSRSALVSNVEIFKNIAGPDRNLMAVVKANAYGHGQNEVAGISREAGVEWFGVFSVHEGLALKAAGIDANVLVLGPFTVPEVSAAKEAGLRLTVASAISAKQIIDQRGALELKVHIKIETGTNRQGLLPSEIGPVLKSLESAGVTIEGIYTHFADIEDTTDHTFAMRQLSNFQFVLSEFGERIPLPHTACTAAAILFPETYFKMVRVGIGLFGLWPSKETQVSAMSLKRNSLGLKPVMTWKTRIAQIKDVPKGDYIGYGRSFRTTRKSKIAVLPIGYTDGYDRKLSNGARVLVSGTRAPVVGRVCMNLTMVDVTDVPDASVDDEVVLLGKQGEEAITVEDLARLAGTINYEIVARIAPFAPRIIVP